MGRARGVPRGHCRTGCRAAGSPSAGSRTARATFRRRYAGRSNRAGHPRLPSWSAFSGITGLIPRAARAAVARMRGCSPCRPRARGGGGDARPADALRHGLDLLARVRLARGDRDGQRSSATVKGQLELAAPAAARAAQCHRPPVCSTHGIPFSTARWSRHGRPPCRRSRPASSPAPRPNGRPSARTRASRLPCRNAMLGR